MRNGTHTVFVIESRLVAESEHGKPETPIKPAKKPWEWGRYNTFDTVMVPHIGSGNDRRPQNKQAYEEWHDSHRTCSVHGWYTLKYAVAALKRARKANEEGMGDYRDPSSHRISQRCRYEFRLVKYVTTYNRTVSEVSTDDLIDQLAA